MVTLLSDEVGVLVTILLFEIVTEKGHGGLSKNRKRRVCGKD
jgi:hypothetical protein